MKKILNIWALASLYTLVTSTAMSGNPNEPITLKSPTGKALIKLSLNNNQPQWALEYNDKKILK